MTTIGIIGSGHVGSNLAKAAIAHGYDVVLPTSPRPSAPLTSCAYPHDPNRPSQPLSPGPPH